MFPFYHSDRADSVFYNMGYNSLSILRQYFENHRTSAEEQDGGTATGPQRGRERFMRMSGGHSKASRDGGDAP